MNFLSLIHISITVYVREKAAETRSINVNYVDESGNIIGTETVEVPQNAGNFNASLLKNVPEKYALAATGDVALVPDSDSVDVLVRLKAVSYTHLGRICPYIPEYPSV